ncbi:outer membrane protein [Methylorubrum sp. SB2]|uniref:outer membrane protein n=1 Tax=Methylorubrum subtropicum TaxID=3138812 RepID=UPI00313BC253
MRIATLGLLAVLASATTVTAADLDYGYLRGADDGYAPAPVIDWSGFYIGGHGGYSSAAMGFTNTLNNQYASYLRARDIEAEYNASNYLALPSRRVNGASYGALAGYNVQFDDIVVGIEADYTNFGRIGSSSMLRENAISRSMTTKGGMFETISLFGTSKTELEDYGTIRGRLGYALGSFLPFVTGGVAIGRATISNEANIQNYGYDIAGVAAYQNDPSAGIPANHGYVKNGFNPRNPNASTPEDYKILPFKSKSKAMAGVALGAGLEFALTSNIILRGEYQYVLFDDFDGHKVNVNTVRGGAAVKF